MAKRSSWHSRRGGTTVAAAHDDIAKRLLEHRLRRPIVEPTGTAEAAEPGTSVVEPVSGLRASVPDVVDITRAELELRIAELERALERISALVAELRERLRGRDAVIDARLVEIQETLASAAQSPGPA